MLRPRRRLPPATITLVCAVLALALGSSSAQESPRGLTEVLPATTVAVFHAAPSATGFDVFREILDGLDLDAALATLAALGGESTDVGPTDVGTMIDGFVDGLSAECPQAGDVWGPDALEGLEGPAVLAVSVSPFNPIPAGIAVARPGDAALAAALQDALVACFGTGLVMNEGDVELHVVGDGSDLPLVLGRVDGLFFAATNPELARSAVRLARGGDEPRHVDGAIGREASALVDSGLAFTLDFAALADALEGLRGMVPVEEAGPAIDRLLATLRTVGGVAARITTDADGVLVDSVMTVDPAGGDVELARLLACAECRPSEPQLVPSGVVSLQARVVSPVAIVEWIDGWLLTVGELIGEPLDLRALAQEFGAIDLDAALLDWVGTTWHTAQVEPLGTDVRGWVTGPGTITTVPVASEAAARAGIATWRDALERASGMLGDTMMGGGPFGSLLTPGDGAAEAGMLAVRDVTYRGVAYERWRIGPTVDVAVTVLDDHLVIASPSRTIRAAIDVHHGAPTVQDDPVLGEALARLPEDASGYDLVDVARTLEALAALADFVAAPAASALGLAMVESRTDGWEAEDEWGWSDDWDTSAGAITGLDRGADRFGDDPATSDGALETLGVPTSRTLEIGPSDVLSNGDLGLVLELVDVQPGDLVQIEMLDPTASDIDTYLYLFDLDAGRVVADNDDAPGWDRSEIVFEAVAGARYAVVASSWNGSSTGTIILNTTVLVAAEEGEEDAEPEADTDSDLDSDLDTDLDDAEAPLVTFDETVALFDVVTAFLEELAARSGVAVGSTVVDDGIVRSTLRIPLR